MGNLCPPADPQEGQTRANLNDAKVENSNVKRLLLLGVGGSGKSTFFKQLQLIHGSGLSNTQRAAFKQAISKQVITQMVLLAKRCEEWHTTAGYEELTLSPESAEIARQLTRENDANELTPDITNWVVSLWSEPAIKAAWERRAQFAVYDSCGYFWDNIERIAQTDYVPTDEDCIQLRNPTTGMTDKILELNGDRIQIVDVGGQRSERRKWINFFEGVDAVIYVVSLSAFDELLYEDERDNVMQESMQVFEETINSEWFQKTPIILFLNKRDLFEMKIQLGLSIRACFPDYDGTDEIEPSLEHIRKEYLARNQNQGRDVYIHVTTATNKTNVQSVFDDVTHAIIQRQLDQSMI